MDHLMMRILVAAPSLAPKLAQALTIEEAREHAQIEHVPEGDPRRERMLLLSWWLIYPSGAEWRALHAAGLARRWYVPRRAWAKTLNVEFERKGLAGRMPAGRFYDESYQVIDPATGKADHRFGTGFCILSVRELKVRLNEDAAAALGQAPTKRMLPAFFDRERESDRYMERLTDEKRATLFRRAA